MSKKKNGFTLVELLVAVAIMLTILGIAIISFVTVSNRKKKEAWESVKSQIETAAESYANTNAYLFEGLGDEGEGYISVGALVEGDYLNKVVNPMTGTGVSKCMVVRVKKKDGKLESDVVESSENSIAETCDTDSSISLVETGGPEITSITKECGKNPWPVSNNNWCNIYFSENPSNIKSGKTIFTASASEKEHGRIVSIDAAIVDSYSDPKTITTYTAAEGGKMESDKSTSKDGKYICFKATNIGGKSGYKCDKFKSDFIRPFVYISGITRADSDPYNARLTGQAEDNNSGLSDITTTPNVFSIGVSSGTQSKEINVVGRVTNINNNVRIVAKDVAGNISPPDELAYNVVTTTTAATTRRTTSTTTRSYSCADIKYAIDGAVEGNNGWYRKGTTCEDSGRNIKNFCLTITPPDGVHHWEWATDNPVRKSPTDPVTYYTHSYNNKGVQVKSLGDGYRRFRITLYDNAGNSISCEDGYNIDTTGPKVTLDSARVEFVNDDGVVRGDDISESNKIVSFGKITYGATFFCAKADGEEKAKTSGSGKKITHICQGESSYSADDELNDVDLSTAVLYDVPLTANNTFNFFDQSSGGGAKPYPFPAKYCVEVADTLGNIGKGCINAARYYDGYVCEVNGKYYDYESSRCDGKRKQNLKSVLIGWDKSLGDENFRKNVVWPSNCWNKTGNAAANCFMNLK